MSDKNSEYREKQHENYRHDRRAYVDADLQGAAFFDKTIITLSSSAFGLTITMVTKAFAKLAPGTIDYLTLALDMFAISMISTLLTFIVNHFVITRQIELMDEHQKQPVISTDVIATKTRYIVLILNFAQIICFVIGAVYLVKFMSTNLEFNNKEVIPMTEKKTNARESFRPATPPVTLKNSFPVPAPTVSLKKSFPPSTPPVPQNPPPAPPKPNK